MTISPYSGKPESSWLGTTQQLISSHPLKSPELLDAATTAWATLWQTTVGTGAISVRLSDLRVPATIVGYFFEVLLARELERRAPTSWRGNLSKEDKDLVYIPDPAFSVEIKTSGQAGFKVFGNRSYGQKSGTDLIPKKEKSGFYITVNFYHRTLTLIRFGWIDASDWDPQEAPTGQMAGLKPAVYENKLVPIPGAYRQHAPVILLDSVGPSTSEQLRKLGISTIGDLLRFDQELPDIVTRIRRKNQKFLDGCVEPAPP